MTRDDIIRMAKEAGFEDGYGDHLFPPGDYREEVIPVTDEIIRFAAIVAAHEREACAKVCEKMADNIYSNSHKDSQPMPHAVAKFCADAIRARGET